MAARSALRTHAVLVVAPPADGRSTVVTAAGVDFRIRDALTDALNGAAIGLNADSADVFEGLGFRVAGFASLQLGDETLGNLLAIVRRDYQTDCRAACADHRVVDAFARHFAVALQASSERFDEPLLSDYMGTLDALDQGIVGAPEPEELIATVDMALRPLLGPVRCGIVLRNEEHGALELLPGSFAAGSASEYRPGNDVLSTVVRVFQSGCPYITPDAHGDPGVLQDYLDLYGLEQLMCVELPVGGRSTGVLSVAGGDAPFTFRDLETVQTLAPRIASRLGFARTAFSLRRREKLTAAVSSVAVDIGSTHNPLMALPRAFDHLARALKATTIAFVPLDGPTIANDTGSLIPETATPPIQYGNRGADPGCSSHKFEDGSLACSTAVYLDHRQVGTLVALRDGAVEFSQDEQQTLLRSANLVAVAIAAERHQTQSTELVRFRERQRIADSLHDHVSQLLFAAQLALDSARTDSPDLALAPQIARAHSLLVKGDRIVREVIDDLSDAPTDLVRDLTAITESIHADFGIEPELVVDDAAATAGARLGKASAEALARVAREALTNVAKHAGSCEVRVSLDYTNEDQIVLCVADNGSGVPENGNRRGHGLVSLERCVYELGGTFELLRPSSGGTTVRATIALS